MVGGRYLYILGQKVTVTTELCQHFSSISYINAGWREEDTYLFWGQKVKGQGHNGTL